MLPRGGTLESPDGPGVGCCSHLTFRVFFATSGCFGVLALRFFSAASLYGEDVRTTLVVLVCLFFFVGGGGGEQLAMTAQMPSSEGTGLVSTSGALAASVKTASSVSSWLVVIVGSVDREVVFWVSVTPVTNSPTAATWGVWDDNSRISNSASNLLSLYGHKPLVANPLTAVCIVAVQLYARSNSAITSYCVMARPLFDVSQLSHDQLNADFRDLKNVRSSG